MINGIETIFNLTKSYKENREQLYSFIGSNKFDSLVKTISFRVIIPAAGKGTRLGLSIPKTLVKINGKPILIRILETVYPYDSKPIVVVNKESKELIENQVRSFGYDIETVIQENQYGMAHAVLQAYQKLENYKGGIIVVWGDMPHLSYCTLSKSVCFFKLLNESVSAVVPTVMKRNPYIVFQRNSENRIARVFERRKDDTSIPAIGESDCGLFVLDSQDLFSTLIEMWNIHKKKYLFSFDSETLKTDPSKEFSFVPLLVHLEEKYKSVLCVPLSNEKESIGINTPEELIDASVESHENQKDIDKKETKSGESRSTEQKKQTLQNTFNLTKKGGRYIETFVSKSEEIRRQVNKLTRRQVIEKTLKSKKLNVVMFSGGRGGQSICKYLVSNNYNVTIVVNPYDDGLSTGKMRHAFDIIGISDIRKNVINLLNETIPEQFYLKEIFKYRFDHREKLSSIMQYLSIERCIEKDDELETIYKAIDSLPQVKKQLLKTYIREFCTAVDTYSKNEEPYSFEDTSLGNCIYAGAYFLHNRNMGLAMKIISKKMLEHDNTVLMNSADNLWLSAVTYKEEFINCEAELVEKKWKTGIRQIFLTEKPVSNGLQDLLISNDSLVIKSTRPFPDPEVLVAIKTADLIIYAPGTLHSSLLPTYMTIGIPEAIRSSGALKILVTNIENDNDTVGFQSIDYLNKTVKVLSSHDICPGESNEYVDYVLIHDTNIDNTNIAECIQCTPEYNIVRQNFEDGLLKGRHDGEKTVKCINHLVKMHTLSIQEDVVSV